MAQTEHDRITAGLFDFINQRPGLDPRNYISHWADDAGRTAYRSESRQITRDLQDARTLLREVSGRTFTQDQWAAAFRAYSGRLSWDGTRLDYCTGQYWPTEYRRAVCAVVASLLWHDYREAIGGMDLSSGGDAIRTHFRQRFGRGLAKRWFH
jgi:hypothetical protein